MNEKMNDYDFVCISLVDRPYRQRKSKELFKKLGILDKINWWIVQKHPQGGLYGCFESHWHIWNSKEFQKPYLCIFEDDLLLNDLDAFRFYSTLLNASDFMFNQLDLIILEPGLGFIEKKITGSLYEGGFIHLGCYLISRESIPKLSQKTIQWFGIDLDLTLYKNCAMGAIFPPIFKQGLKNSDNTGGYKEIQLPLEKIWKSTSQLHPYLGWLNLELAQLLSVYYIIRKNQQLEFADRRITE
jgi:hypothetical protein